MAGLKRLAKEWADMVKTPTPGIVAAPKDPNNLLVWSAYMKGPSPSPYELGTFELEMVFPAEYPNRPPQVVFITNTFHMNLRFSNGRGAICLDILQGEWTPALKITQLLLSISSLLTDPNPASPYNSEISRLYLSDRKAHDEKAREWTLKYAVPATAADATKASASPAASNS
jgi:ubiquitin-conjugating enzyme E2 D/E